MNAATLPQPDPSCNGGAQPVTALDHANAMVDHLRSVGPGFGHELARAMLVSAAFYLREVFGQQHAVAVAAALVPPVLGVGEPAPAEVAPIGGEAASVEMPSVVLH